MLFSWEHDEPGGHLQPRAEELPGGGQQAAPGRPGGQPAGRPALGRQTRLQALGGGLTDRGSTRHKAVQVSLWPDQAPGSGSWTHRQEQYSPQGSTGESWPLDCTNEPWPLGEDVSHGY